jgi:hypothetical protein
MRIIGLTGRKHSGKTTVAEHLEAEHGFVRLAFADPLKRACAEIFGLDVAQLADPTYKATPLPEWDGLTPRQILQWTGTELFRERFHELATWTDDEPRVWVRACVNRIEEYRTALRHGLPGEFIPLSRGHLDLSVPFNGVVVEDCRFDDEADALRALGGEIVCIRRPRDGAPVLDTHASEAGVHEKLITYSIYNGGDLVDLRAAVDKWISG